MIGLSILLAVVSYVWLARFVARRIENRAAKYTVIAIFILIPTWDVIPGKLYFNHLCETQGGEKIYKTVSGVDGFFYDGYAYKEWFAPPYSYKYVETRINDDMRTDDYDPRKARGILLHYFENGEMLDKEMHRIASRYYVRQDVYPRTLSWIVKIKIWDVHIYDLVSGDALATSTEYLYAGGWVNRIISGIDSGSAEYIPCHRIRLEKFIASVLQTHN